MSMDYLKTTYRPSIPRDTKSRCDNDQCSPSVSVPFYCLRRLDNRGHVENMPVFPNNTGNTDKQKHWTSYSQMNSWMQMPPMGKQNVVQVNRHDPRLGRYGHNQHGAVSAHQRVPPNTSYHREHRLRNILAEESHDMTVGETEYTSRYSHARHVNKHRLNSEVSRGRRQLAGGGHKFGQGWFGGSSNIPPPVHLQYYKSGGYDDAHKAFRNLENQNLAHSFPHYGPPRLRNGHVGGSWRHVKEVLQAGGRRIVFVDGQISDDDRHRAQRVTHGDIIRPIIRKHYNEEHTAMVDLQPDALPRQRRTRQLNMTAYRDVEGQNAREKVNWNIMR